MGCEQRVVCVWESVGWYIQARGGQAGQDRRRETGRKSRWAHNGERAMDESVTERAEVEAEQPRIFDI